MDAVPRRVVRDLWARGVHRRRPAHGRAYCHGAQGGTVDVVWEAASVTVPMSRRADRQWGDPREHRPRPWQAAGQWRVNLDRSSWWHCLSADTMRTSRDHRGAHHAGDGRDGRLAVLCGGGCVTILSRSRGRWRIWTPWAPAPRTWPTSACAWYWNRRTAACTTGCTRRAVSSAHGDGGPPGAPLERSQTIGAHLHVTGVSTNAP